MELSNTKRASYVELNAIAEAQGIAVPERTVGYICPLEVGDVITFDGDETSNIFLTTMGKSLLDEKGDLAKGCYWVRDVEHVHNGVKLRTDFAASSLSRTGKKFPTLNSTQMVRGKSQDNLGGFALYEEVLDSLKLDAKTRQLNLDLSKPEGEIAKLKALAGKTLKVIHTFQAWTLRMNTKEEAEWGSKPAHWRPIKLLYFEAVKSNGKSN